MMICRRTPRSLPDRGDRPRLPRGIGLEGLPADADRSAASRCRPGCARATGCPSRSSPRPPRRRSGEHDENIDFDDDGRAPRIVGSTAGRSVARRPRPGRRSRRCLRCTGTARRSRAGGDHPGRHEVRVRARVRTGELLLIDEVLTPDSSRFWDAAAYEPGRAQASYDKQFVRDWLETQPWDKTAPGPELPADVVDGTRARYVEAFERITGASFPRYLEEDVIAR